MAWYDNASIGIGSPDDVDALARMLEEVGQSAETAAQHLFHFVHTPDDAWRTPAGALFRVSVEELPKQLATCRQSHKTAANALSAFARDFRALRERSINDRNRALSAKHDFDVYGTQAAARKRLLSDPSNLLKNPTGPLSDPELKRLQRLAADADSKLRSLKKDYERASQDFEKAAATAIGLVREAGDLLYGGSHFRRQWQEVVEPALAKVKTALQITAAVLAVAGLIAGLFVTGGAGLVVVAAWLSVGVAAVDSVRFFGGAVGGGGISGTEYSFSLISAALSVFGVVELKNLANAAVPTGAMKNAFTGPKVTTWDLMKFGKGIDKGSDALVALKNVGKYGYKQVLPWPNVESYKLVNLLPKLSTSTKLATDSLAGRPDLSTAGAVTVSSVAGVVGLKPRDGIPLDAIADGADASASARDARDAIVDLSSPAGP